MFYFRFLICLAIGLLGIGLMLKTIFDALLEDWDVVADLKVWADRNLRRHRQVAWLDPSGLGADKIERLATRLGQNRKFTPIEKQFLPSPEAVSLRMPVIAVPKR